MLNTTIVAVGIDEPTAQHLITTGHALENPGPSAEALFVRMAAAPADALILGNHTDLNGNFVRLLRAEEIGTPAIRIANGPRNGDWSEACIEFLDAGGDDVLVGPPYPEEVGASIRAVCRRAHIEPDHIERFELEESILEVNLTKHRIFVNNERVAATAYETMLLFALAASRGPVLRSYLDEHLHWAEIESNSVEVLVCRLRKHLGNAAPLLNTVRGVGYELLGRVH